MEKIPVTVEILTRNSSATLRRALESVKDFAEIIIVDGKSSDDTRMIAQEFGARVIDQDERFLDAQGRIADFASIRNQGLDAATQPWFFYLDSDEYLGTELAASIRSAVRSSDAKVYNIFRRYILEGKEVECATTYPNRSLRLFERASVLRFRKLVHELIELKADAQVADLREGFLYVPVGTNRMRQKEKEAYYIALEVQQRTPLPFRRLMRVTSSIVRSSIAYLVRLVHVTLFCSGVRMPLWDELERHQYNMKLLVALWRKYFSLH